MSDTTVADTGAPAQTEVPVNESPVQTPTPIGSQAPDKPGVTPGDTPSGRPQSRREAIQAAFERANNPPPKTKEPAKPAPKPREAKAGDNNPPEETPKLDLKKRPADQEYSRGERGRFAPRQPAEAQTAPGAQVKPPSERPAAAPQKQLPANAPYREAPPRMSAHAQAAWADTPEHVRGDIYRMHQEFSQAHQQYQADYQAMNEIRDFQQLATQHNTTLRQALTNFVGMEQKLRADPIAGLDQIVHNLNIKGQNGQRITLRDIAYHVLSQTPDQLRQVQQGNAQQAASNQIGALHQEVAGLKNTLQQMHTQQQFTYTRSQVDQFADDGQHPRFDELADIIKAELETGYSLDEAYRRAELLRPGTHAAQTRTHSAQTRDSDRSISGAPASGVPSQDPNRRRNEKPVGRREAISNAIRRANGSL